MKVMSSNKMIVIDGVPAMMPYARYVMPEELSRMLYEQRKDIDWKISGAQSFERRYMGEDLNEKKVCIVRYNGIGDMLIVTSLPKYLKTLYPRATIDFYCMTSYASPVWDGNQYLEARQFLPLPVPLDSVQQYDYHIWYDGMIEANAEHDQNNAYDDMFRFVGLYDVPDEFKVPNLWIHPSDNEFALQTGIDLTGRYIVYQQSSSTPVRDYPLEKGAEFCEMFLDSNPTWRLFITGEREEPEFCRLKGRERVVWLAGQVPKWRSLIPILKHASCVISPDTGIAHLAACFPEVPTVMLCGSFSANCRYQYYRNHHPLQKPEVCPSAPCWQHGQEVPKHKCQHAEGFNPNSRYCTVMATIEPEEILQKTQEVIGGKKAPAKKRTHCVTMRNDRLGDRIALMYVADEIKREKDVPIMAMQSFERHPYLAPFTMDTWSNGTFEEVLTVEGGGEQGWQQQRNQLMRRGIYFIGEADYDKNLWVYLPKHAKETGRYPRIEVPENIRGWAEQFKFERPLIAVHCLTDAAYHKSRNHHFNEWHEMMRILAEKYDVVRVGMPTDTFIGNIDLHLMDATRENLDISQTIGLINKATVFCGGDTGLSHAAAALDKKMFGVWGDISGVCPGWDTSYMFNEPGRGTVWRRDKGVNNMEPVFKAKDMAEEVDRLAQEALAA